MSDERFWNTWEALMFVLVGMLVMVLLGLIALPFILWATL